MRCSKSCHLCDFELVSLFENKVTEQINYVPALKGNHSIMEKEVKDFFECTVENSRSRRETFDKGHGRIERRIYTLDTNIGWATGKKSGKTLQPLVCITKRKDKKMSEKRYFITSFKDVEQFAKAVRNHWAIENNLHWCLDVIFHEDRCPVIEWNTAENLAIIRRIVYNRIKMLSDLDTLAMGQRACIYDDSFRAKILFSQLEALYIPDTELKFLQTYK